MFCLKTAIDDFKHECQILFSFLDFRHAFGTLPHNIMIKALEEIHLPQVYTDIIKDVYKSSFIQVICRVQLTEQRPLRLGIKPGCPWSAVNLTSGWSGCVSAPI